LNKGKYFQIDLYPNNDIEIDPVYNQILATFKFTQSLSNPLVKIYAHGGLCATGSECQSTTILTGDGQYLLNGKLVDTVSAQNVLKLQAAMKNTDFGALRKNTFTGTCPIAYDGQEVIYTFYLENKTEVISSCQVEIDDNADLFKVLSSIIQAE
jgi:hypothetical protein